MKKKIVAYKPLPADVLAYLQENADVTTVDPKQHDVFVAALKDADGAIGASTQITPAMLEGASKLKVLATVSVGFDAFNIDDLNRRGILLTNTPDVLTESTADTVFALILASARRVVELAEWVKEGKWTKSIGEDCFGVDVQGKTLGIIGLGRIGGAVARRASLGFRMNVLYTNRSPNAQAERDYGAKKVDLDELLATSDFVLLQVPLTDETRNLIGAEQLKKMKRSAILINASRGPTVDEDALIQALQDGTILGAGLDVFVKEPLSADSPLLKMKNVVALPHIGSATHETRHAMNKNAAENLIGALNGTLTNNMVNPEALKR
ncbi:Glyoxylate/hydroxypyruvate reductase B [Caballeronia sp. SBC1]|uniref:NAD(P)-dependent oxidoreductase n=1 Tax=unclassified Caballeronia TaxID=2646786 RepID=UPI0013E19219|nr:MULTISPECIES: NAD(P)-dependent oxidoreductase [unclassified Caballeronia]QIE23992.1 Glyoxylate/hydroxypyruvate reductase B [Caballeronia sp. SBC2]QIN61888.1 Glyoxylate/hydroxypyruvate reductase B [Caballeronia sp. SBC1]